LANAHLERRLLAILAMDVVGYSGKMEADEAGTIARLAAVRAKVTDPLIAEARPAEDPARAAERARWWLPVLKFIRHGADWPSNELAACRTGGLAAERLE
jgi:class 3 adenylate cyclase